MMTALRRQLEQAVEYTTFHDIASRARRVPNGDPFCEDLTKMLNKVSRWERRLRITEERMLKTGEER